MKDGKIRIFLLVLLVAGMVMVPMVNAAANGVRQLPEPRQVPMDEKSLKETQKEIIKELQASTVLDNLEKNLLIKQLKEIWSGKSALTESEKQQVLIRVGEVLLQSDSSTITPQWTGSCYSGWPYPHNDMANVSGQKMGLSQNYIAILYNNVGTPDCWAYSIDHYALTGAPENTRDYATRARYFIKNGNPDLGYTYLAYSIHFMTDMSMPFHYIYGWPSQHITYEDYTKANWKSGQMYFNAIQSNNYYYYITDPYASAYNLARYTNQYQSYLISAMSKPGWQNDPTLVQYTRDCFVQGERYDMGLINYVTRS
jgi:hypothetical protein